MTDPTATDLSRLAELVRLAREMRGLTQEGLAQAATVSPRTVVRIEAGEKTRSLGPVLSLLQREIEFIERRQAEESAQQLREAREHGHARLWELLGEVAKLFAQLQARLPGETALSVTDLLSELTVRFNQLEAQVRDYEASHPVTITYPPLTSVEEMASWDSGSSGGTTVWRRGADADGPHRSDR